MKELTGEKSPMNHRTYNECSVPEKEKSKLPRKPEGSPHGRKEKCHRIETNETLGYSSTTEWISREEHEVEKGSE